MDRHNAEQNGVPSSPKVKPNLHFLYVFYDFCVSIRSNADVPYAPGLPVIKFYR